MKCATRAAIECATSEVVALSVCKVSFLFEISASGTRLLVRSDAR